MASSTQYFKIYLNGLRKISNDLRIVGIMVEILGRRLLNASHKHHRFIQLAVPTWCVQVLRSPKDAFAAAKQSWRERCEKCVCLQGDYVEK